MSQCGAKTRNGTPCKQRAMKNGRCYLHGGKSLSGVDTPRFKHGRYSKYAPAAIQDKINTFEQSDPLDLLDELAIQRGLFADYLERFRAGYALSADEIYRMMSWINDIGRMVERIINMRSKAALTAAEVQYLQARIVDVTVKYIHDPQKRRQFISELFGLDAVPADGTQRPIITAGSDGSN